MAGRFIILATLMLTLTACSNFSLFNGQGNNRVEVVPAGGFPADLDNRILITQVTDLTIRTASGGMLIEATGLPPRLGYWDAELVPLNHEVAEDGVLTYEFRISEPWTLEGTGTPYSRRVLVAHFVSTAKLQGVHTIRIVGQSNSLTARR